MDGFRYVLAILMAVSVPPAIVYWLVVHPLAGFWRRVGKAMTFTILAALWIVSLLLCWRFRHTLLGRDLGTTWWLIVPGGALYSVAAGMSRAVNQHLKLAILLGLPEITADKEPGKLLTEGIYGRIRHPRYAAFLIAIAGAGLIVNYANLYIMIALTFPALHLVAVIEERELRQRFGEAYAAYAAAVPRLIPRLGRNA